MALLTTKVKETSVSDQDASYGPDVLGPGVRIEGKMADFSADKLNKAVMYFTGFVVLSFTAFGATISFIITSIVRDKETKVRETLRIMGMRRLPYMAAYFAAQGIFSTLTSIILVAAFYLPVRFSSNWSSNAMFELWQHPVLLFVAIFLFGLAMIAMTLACSTLFHDSKIAGQISFFIIFLPLSLFLLAIVDGTNKATVAIIKQEVFSYAWIQAGYIMPHFSFGIIVLEYFSGGMGL